jgi:hypothetical protein
MNALRRARTELSLESTGFIYYINTIYIINKIKYILYLLLLYILLFTLVIIFDC